jgi:hypothetical protein
MRYPFLRRKILMETFPIFSVMNPRSKNCYRKRQLCLNDVWVIWLQDGVRLLWDGECGPHLSCSDFKGHCSNIWPSEEKFLRRKLLLQLEVSVATMVLCVICRVRSYYGAQRKLGRPCFWINDLVKFYIKQTNSVALVRKRTIPTERPPLLGEVSANFSG